MFRSRPLGKGCKQMEQIGQVHGSIVGIVNMGSHVSGSLFLLLLLVSFSLCFFFVSLVLVNFVPHFSLVVFLSCSGSVNLVLVNFVSHFPPEV